MRKIYTLIIFGFVLSHLSAQQLSTGGAAVWTSVNPSSSRAYVQASASESSSDMSSEVPQIRLYPNPAGDQIQVTAGDRMIGNTIRIFSLLGTEMMSRSLESGLETLDITRLSRGLYLYSIIDKNSKTVLSGKFNKQ